MSAVSGFNRLSVLEHANVVVSILGLVFVWWLLAVNGAINSLPGPLPAVNAMVSMLPTGEFHSSVIASLRHVFVPYLAATALAVPLGVAIGLSLTFRDLVFPSLEMLRPVPPIAWIPIAILVLPTTLASIMFITFMGAFFPILLNTIRGVERVEPDYVKAVQCLGGTRRDVLRQAILPAALPSIHTGLVIGMGLAWVNLVAAEMIADAGLGRLIWVAYTTGNYANIVAGVIFVGLLGYASSTLVRWIGQRRMSWNVETAS
ncbi:ABC transporter permease [Saliphagus infecundisoli]|uniref:ABC transporter permease n=1 Tax=Saliphagus infecundisoli TaxID=1849069 RepID=A0ABD5QB22_9EURY|nr:ABC transporter permease [Saliphagus infecundisoli]